LPIAPLWTPRSWPSESHRSTQSLRRQMCRGSSEARPHQPRLLSLSRNAVSQPCRRHSQSLEAPEGCNGLGGRFRYSLDMDSLLGIPELASYISALSIAMQHSKWVGERNRYRDHLAITALMFERLHSDDLVSVRQFVAEERESYDWDVLVGDFSGATAQSAFSRFADFIEGL
jgi:hypothetical protein